MKLTKLVAKLSNQKKTFHLKNFHNIAHCPKCIFKNVTEQKGDQ